MQTIIIPTIEKKIIEIKDVILKKDSSSIGLLSGEMGEIIFLEYYNKYFEDKEVSIRINFLLEKCYENISKGFFAHSYCNGLSGALFGLEFINRKGFEDIDISEVMRYYLKLLTNKMFQDIHNKNYDFLHGAIGVALYLLRYNSSENQSSLREFVKHLEYIGIGNIHTIKWKSDDPLRNAISYNISMSHGMASIALFLTKMIQANIAEKECQLLIIKTVNYILEQEINCFKYGCYFPSLSIESEYPDISKSRLGWCYGDLGVAIMLWETGKILNNSEWKNKALDIFRFSVTRRDLIENRVFDASICHGTSGVAQIFRRIYYETNDELFFEASNYWINQTLDLAMFDNEFARYRFLVGYPDSFWQGDYGLLNGISGIGLALLASIGDKSYSDWDEILLLS